MLSPPGFEPGLSRPQRDVLTTRRWRLVTPVYTLTNTHQAPPPPVWPAGEGAGGGGGWCYLLLHLWAYDSLPEWSKGVDSSSTSASCVGSNPTAVKKTWWSPTESCCWAWKQKVAWLLQQQPWVSSSISNSIFRTLAFRHHAATLPGWPLSAKFPAQGRGILHMIVIFSPPEEQNKSHFIFRNRRAGGAFF